MNDIEKFRLISFFEILMKIDKRECITPTAKKGKLENERVKKKAFSNANGETNR